MAWQVLLVKLPDSLGSLGDLPEDYQPPVLGEPEAVSECIVRAVAHADVRHDVAQNVVALRADDFVIEAELGGVLSVDRVVLSVFGSDAAWPLIGDVARALGAAAIDCETDAVLDPSSVVPDTLREWQARVDDLR
ncbi:MAG TPA: hypothetical protein VLM85_06920 [Polyangiaceae bacterium]|nr:hypothetical protein [Polyangiaceae bacterium]